MIIDTRISEEGIELIKKFINKYIKLDFTSEELDSIIFDEYERCYKEKGKEALKYFKEQLQKRLDNIVITKIKKDKNDYLLNDFIKANEPFVEFYIKKYCSVILKYFMMDEVISLGLIGINEAIKTFDTTRGISFSHWASQKIRKKFTDEIRDNGYTIRKPSWVIENSNIIKKAIAYIEARGKEVTIEKLAEVTGIKESTVKYCMRRMISTEVTSLNAPVNKDKSKKTKIELIDTIAGTNRHAFSKYMERKELRQILHLIMKDCLNEKQYKIISALFYGIDGVIVNESKLAEMLNVTRGAINQQKKKALTLIKSSPLVVLLNDYCENTLKTDEPTEAVL